MKLLSHFPISLPMPMIPDSSLTREDKYYLATYFAHVGATELTQQIKFLHVSIRAIDPEYRHHELNYDSHNFYIAHPHEDQDKIIHQLSCVVKTIRAMILPSHDDDHRLDLAEESKDFSDLYASSE